MTGGTTGRDGASVTLRPPEDELAQPRAGDTPLPAAEGERKTPTGTYGTRLLTDEDGFSESPAATVDADGTTKTGEAECTGGVAPATRQPAASGVTPTEPTDGEGGGA